ncbi:MAG: hypothetical protein M1457_01880, partial [bacterium]|nr:hypothetical protein [bacterium]
MNILCLFRFTFRRAAAAHLVAAAAALGLLAAAGCAFLGASLNPAGLLHPTLRAAWVPSVPLPNQRVETEVWGRAKPLIIDVVRRSGSVDDRVSVKLFAIHDGRALSILAMWADDRETFLRRDWLWKPEKHDYVLETNPVDEFMIEWPMRGSRDPCMLNGKESTWDVWQWFAGWTDIGGYAEDRTMEIKRRPPGTRPADVEGRLYPAIGGRGLVEIVWRDDEGVGGTTVNRKPTAYKEWVI